MAIIILGLGPADSRFLTIEARDLLEKTEAIYLRTSKHPAAAELSEHLTVVDFDHIYREAEDFASVYEKIAEEICSLGSSAGGENQDIIYGVPGHPLVGESTTPLILSKAKDMAIPVRIVAGMSFIEPILTLLKVDGLDGLQLFDALEIAVFHHPPIDPDRPALLAQVYSGQVASDVKLALMALFPDEHEVVLVHGAGLDEQTIERTPLYMIDRSSHLSHLSSLFLPALVEPGSLSTFTETVAYLRSPQGCPWDREQTSKSLRGGLLEETAEVLEAIDAGDSEALAEELGDLLYHIILQIQIASEEGQFQMSDVIGGIDAKLKRRHPHVWGDANASTSEEVIQTWEHIKSMEKAVSGSVLDNIPPALPSLAKAQLIQDRVRSIGFDWQSINGVIDKMEEELLELKNASSDLERSQELGDALFALVNWSRWLDLEAETALREANNRFIQRFQLLEELAVADGIDIKVQDIEDLENLWQKAKAESNLAGGE